MSDKPKVNDGGPMFSRPDAFERGASVHVWLAGQALAGLCANWQAMKECEANGMTVSEAAVLAADRTIAALEKGAK